MAARRIIIDTDPGQDDAVAILTALASPELDLLGLSVVAGNVPLHLTVANALRVCDLARRPDLPVHAGCDRPLLETLHTSEVVHGVTGLDGSDLPPPSRPPTSGHAVDWLIATLRAAPDRSVTLCPIAPQTNLAMAIRREPEILRAVDRIVMMGGSAFFGGNASPAAEFNVFVDPHAAAIVFGCGVPITMIPLDCTHKALMPRWWLDDLRALGTPVGRAVAGMMTFNERYDRQRYGTEAGPLHDPCVIAWLLRPDLFGGKDCPVAVETTSPLTRGMTVVDWWGKTGQPATVHVVTEIDREAVFRLLFDRLQRYDGRAGP